MTAVQLRALVALIQTPAAAYVAVAGFVVGQIARYARVWWRQ